MNNENRFYIVNECDRPCARLIAERIQDGKLSYINTELRKQYPSMSMKYATPLESFGIEFIISGGFLIGGLIRDSKAKYRDGGARHWQGGDSFCVEYIEQDHE